MVLKEHWPVGGAYHKVQHSVCNVAQNMLPTRPAEVCGSEEGSNSGGEVCQNNWFQQKAREMEMGMRGGKGAWKGLRKIQRGRVGLRSIKPSAVKHLDGMQCVGQDDMLQRWHEHF